MDLHPMEQRLLRQFQIDLDVESVRKDYVRLREIFAALGQIGPLPVPTLIEFARRHWGVGAPNPPAPETVVKTSRK